MEFRRDRFLVQYDFCCTQPIFVKLVQSYALSVHLYADDIQIYGFRSPSSVDQLQMRMSACVDAVANWISSNRLQLNAIKTEFLWRTSARRQNQLPTSPFRVRSDHVTPSTSVRDLGISHELSRRASAF